MQWPNLPSGISSIRRAEVLNKARRKPQYRERPWMRIAGLSDSVLSQWRSGKPVWSDGPGAQTLRRVATIALAAENCLQAGQNQQHTTNDPGGSMRHHIKGGQQAENAD